MYRALILTAVCGTVLAGLGCKHVGGGCDCTHNAAGSTSSQYTQPYPVVGQPVPAPAPAPAAMPSTIPAK